MVEMLEGVGCVGWIPAFVGMVGGALRGWDTLTLALSLRERGFVGSRLCVGRLAVGMI